ncbi:tetratricopeptide repeat protein [Neisseria leonii]|uniref:tetratricopeptide repeat protein n=1 Tax=Neisseria leonii TaxID=2995413 RepID=UPI0030D2548A
MMAAWKKQLGAVWAAVWIGLPQAAAETVTVSEPPPQMIIRRSHGEVEDPARLKAITDRSNHLFSLFLAELSLQRGNAAPALGTYLTMLERTKDTEVAERAMDMAVGLSAFDVAESVYRRWVALEPSPGAALRRITWARNMVRGDFEQAAAEWDGALSQADDGRQRQMFLLAAQTAVQSRQAAAVLEDKIHRAALARPEMPEAAVADAVFSVLNDRGSRTVAALHRLAAADGELLPPTELTLRLISRRRPEILGRFFQSAELPKLPPVWRELRVAALAADGKTDEADALLKQLLAEAPSAELYIQAALLEGARKSGRAQTVHYLERAYRSGTQEQQSRAAVAAVLAALEDKDIAAAGKWLARIRAAEYAFDKLFLQAALARTKSEWGQVRRLAEQARAQPSQEGRFFTEEDFFGLYLEALAREQDARRVLPVLNRLYREAQRAGRTERVLDVLYRRGLLYADRLNDSRAALADFRRVADSRPNTESLNALGYTMLQVPGEDLERAFSLIQTAYSQEPESAAVNDSMGWAYFKRGDARAALPYLEYAYRELPHGEVAAHLGEVLLALGEKERALAVFRQGLAGEGAELVRAAMRRLGIKLPAAR